MDVDNEPGYNLPSELKVPVVDYLLIGDPPVDVLGHPLPNQLDQFLVSHILVLLVRDGFQEPGVNSSYKRLEEENLPQVRIQVGAILVRPTCTVGTMMDWESLAK